MNESRASEPMLVAERLDRLLLRTFLYAHLEVTNACNTICTLCPRAAMTRPVKLLDWATFESAMSLVLPSGIPMLSVVGFGEPTLHPRLSDMLSFVRESRQDMIIKVTTNGTASPDRIDELFDVGLDFLELSVFGTTALDYERMTGGLSFVALCSLLRNLNDRGHKYMVTTVATDATSADDLQRFWSSVGARHVEVKGLHRRGGHLKRDGIPLTVSLGHYKQRQHLPGYSRRSDCHKLMMFVHVSCGGEIIPCVQDINSDHTLGHVSEFGSIDEIFARSASLTPTFAICDGCEIGRQDLRSYYVDFFLTHFPSRVSVLE